MRNALSGLASFAVVALFAAMLALGWATGAQGAVADSEWPMFHHDNLHTGRSVLPGPGLLDPGPPPLPGLRWFQGGVFAEESGHRPPGPQGVIWSSAAEGSGTANACKVWYFHNAQWTLGGVPMGIRQLRSEAPETTTEQVLQVVNASGMFDFATSAAIDFTTAASARRDSLTFRNADPSRDDGVLPAGTWRFPFIGNASVSALVQVRFHVLAFLQGNPGVTQLLFSTPAVTLAQGRRRYEATYDSAAISLVGMLGSVTGQNIGIMARIEIVATGGATGEVWYDGTTRTRVVTPIIEPGVRVGCQDGSAYCLNASTGNVMWSYWTGWAAYKSAVRSSPALGDQGQCYFGTEEQPNATTGFVQGRSYAVADDGSLRWVHPSSRRTFNLRSLPDSGGPATRTLMTFRTGSARDLNTFAQTGTSDQFTQFVPGQTSAPWPGPGLRPDSLTQSGWIARGVDFSGRVMPAGRLRLLLSYIVEGSGALPRARLWYRVTKVTIDGSGNVQYGTELIGWTQASADQTLRPLAFSTVGLPIVQTAVIDTDPLDETLFSSSEYLFLELGIQQTLPMSDANGGWRLALDDPLDTSTLTTPLISDGPIGAVTSSPAVSDEDTVYFADTDANVWAVADGAADDLGAGDLVRWSKSLGTGNAVDMSSPALDQTSGRNNVYVGTTGGKVFCLDAGSGGVVWQYPADTSTIGAVIASPAVATNGDIYVGSEDGHIYALTAAGALRWQYPAPAANALGPIRSTPAISINGRAIYFGCGDNPNTVATNEAGLHALRLNADGTLNSYLGQVATALEVQSSPAVGVGGLRIRFFFRSDSEFSGVVPAPDRWLLGAIDMGQHCIDLRTDTPAPPAIGGTFASPLGWLTGPFADGETLEAGTWDFSVQHATSFDSLTDIKSLYFRASRVSVDGSGNLALRALITGGTGGWSVARAAINPGIYYFHQESGGSILANRPPDDPITTLPPQDPGGGEVALGAFVTPQGYPQATHLCAGTWRFHFRAFASTAGTATVRFEVRRRNALGGETSLFFTGSSPLLDTAARDYMVESAQGDLGSLDSTDRIVVGVLAAGTGTVSFQYEGNTGARLSGPIPQILTFSHDLGSARMSAGERIFIEFAIPRQPTDPAWGLVNSLFSSVRSAPVTPPGEELFFGCNDGLARSVLMRFDSGGDPLGFEPQITWQWPAAGRAAFVASPAVGQAITPGIGADPALFIGGGDGVMYCIGPTGTMAPGYGVIPEPVPVTGDLLRLTKSADKQSAATNDNVTFTIRINNPSLPDLLGGTVAQNTTITDQVPTGLSFVSAAPVGSWSYDAATSTITWTLGAIEPQESQTVTFTCTVTATGTPPDSPQPRIEVSHVDFADANPPNEDSDGDYTPDLQDRTARWGEYLYVRATGRGEPDAIANYCTAGWDYLGASQTAQSNTTTVYAGWGKRYRLEFAYDATNDPAGTPPNNQVFRVAGASSFISYTTALELAGTGQRTGRSEEAFDPGAGPASGKNISVFKVQLAPRAYPYGPTAASVAQHPNRPWTPYFWKVSVQQQSPTGDWGSAWGRNDDPSVPRTGTPDPANRHVPNQFDFRVSNPLSATFPVGLPGLAIGAPGGTNPGARSATSGFSLTNRGRFSLSGAGLMPRNVVRWGDSDLGQAGSTFAITSQLYDWRKENYLTRSSVAFYEVRQGSGQQAFSLLPLEYANLAVGDVRQMAATADIPKYLSGGSYRAPAGAAATEALPLYVDLNGNGSWDPGEAYLEQNPAGGLEWDNAEPPVFLALVPPMASMRASVEALDLGRVQVGNPYPGTAAVGVENTGNVGGGAALLASPLVRADSSVPAGSVPRPAAVLDPAAPNTLTVVKTPVGSPQPLVSLGSAAAVAPPDAPAGTYTARIEAKVGDSDAGKASAPLRVQMVEARKTGYPTDPGTGLPLPIPVPGADVVPDIGFYGLDELNLFWSSNQMRWDETAQQWVLRSGTPDPAEPMHLHALRLVRDLNTGNYTWAAIGPYPTSGDPMLQPSESTWLRHWTPGYAADNSTPTSPAGELLVWVGSRLWERYDDSNNNGQWDPGEPITGRQRDNRLLVTDWNRAQPGSILDEPPVALQNNPALMDTEFKARPRIARFWGGQNAWVVYSRGTGESSTIRFVRLEHGASGWAIVAEKALPTSSALAFAADPSGFSFPMTNANNDDLLHVAFAARSHLHRNTDIYYGRWKVEGVNTPQLVGFRRVQNPPERAEKLSDRIYASTHIEWAVGSGLWPQIYVADPGGNPQAIYDPSSSPPRFDAETGRYVIEGAHYYPAGGSTEVTGLKVEFDPAAGAVYFPQAPNPVFIDYNPQLLRLTTHPGRDATPSAFIETYRDLDQNGQPQPANFNPRLWVFWVRAGTAGLAPRLYFKTYRLVGTAPVADAGWQEEIRANKDAAGNYYLVDVGEQAVPLNRSVNEFGLSAVKDPRYAQVWLAWSSTRAAPMGTTSTPGWQVNDPATANADIYLEPLAPLLPPDSQ